MRYPKDLRIPFKIIVTWRFSRRGTIFGTEPHNIQTHVSVILSNSLIDTRARSIDDRTHEFPYVSRLEFFGYALSLIKWLSDRCDGTSINAISVNSVTTADDASPADNEHAQPTQPRFTPWIHDGDTVTGRRRYFYRRADFRARISARVILTLRPTTPKRIGQIVKLRSNVKISIATISCSEVRRLIDFFRLERVMSRVKVLIRRFQLFARGFIRPMKLTRAMPVKCKILFSVISHAEKYLDPLYVKMYF